MGLHRAPFPERERWRRPRCERSVVVVPIERDVVAVMSRDISVEKRARDDLETERLRAAGLLSDANGLACILDERGAITYHPPWSQPSLGHAPGTVSSALDIIVA